MKLDRIMLKLSGEALAGEKKTGFDEATVLAIAEQVKKVSALGKEIGIVSVAVTSGEDVPVRIWTEPRQTR